MFYVKGDDDFEYRVRYRHLREEKLYEGLLEFDTPEGKRAADLLEVFDALVEEAGLTFRGITAVTECIIERFKFGVGWDECGYGQAFCRMPDQFSRPVGRYISFTRAVQAFPPEDRQAFWDAFFEVDGQREREAAA